MPKCKKCSKELSVVVDNSKFPKKVQLDNGVTKWLYICEYSHCDLYGVLVGRQ